MLAILTPDLEQIRAAYAAGGYSLWVVGGATRDHLAGTESKDIDLATDATPDEQVEMLNRAGVRFIPTGLQHGTITAIVNGCGYEITSLRIDTNHDGRHADVEFTRDIEQDLSRRDLTINAIAMDFDGNVVDPFGGRADLMAGRVRFVGDPRARMEEDYLRILRFFRFHARFSTDETLDDAAREAIATTRGGLLDISEERVWSEIKRIITGPNAARTLRAMQDLALFEILAMPYGNYSRLDRALDKGVSDPASVMGFFVSDADMLDVLAREWKWSTAERQRAAFMARAARPNEENLFDMLVDGMNGEWVEDLSRFFTVDVPSTAIPNFPVTGDDLKARGMRPGPEMGNCLKAMRQLWVASRYTLSKDELMGAVG